MSEERPTFSGIGEENVRQHLRRRQEEYVLYGTKGCCKSVVTPGASNTFAEIVSKADPKDVKLFGSYVRYVTFINREMRLMYLNAQSGKAPVTTIWRGRWPNRFAATRALVAGVE